MRVQSSRNSGSKHADSKIASVGASRLGLHLENYIDPENGELPTAISGTQKAKPEDAERHSRSRELIRAGLEALDSVDAGVLVTDELGKLLVANHVAEQILQLRDGIEVSPAGAVLVATDSGLRPLIDSNQKTPQRKTSDGPSMGDAINVVPRGSEKRPLTVLIRPLNSGGVQRQAMDPAFVIFLLDPERPTEATEDELRELYEFTAAEARLASLLMSGKTFAECCKLLGVRASTLRMHLGNLFAKTGVRRQGQLVSLLLRSLGMVRSAAAPHLVQKESAPDANEEPGLDVGGVLSASLEALNWLDLGIVVLNRLGSILFTNQRATKILMAKDGLQATPQGTLSTTQKRWPQSLSLPSRTLSPMDAVFAVPRANGQRPLTLIVRSLNVSNQRSGAEGPAALVFVVDPELAVEATEARLQVLFEFTASEARLARLLMEGRTIDECCGPLSIRASTARRHLANIFSKTDVCHQRQLVSLLLKSAGSVRGRSDGHLSHKPRMSPRSMTSPYTPLSTSRGIRL